MHVIVSVVALRSLSRALYTPTTRMRMHGKFPRSSPGFGNQFSVLPTRLLHWRNCSLLNKNKQYLLSIVKTIEYMRIQSAGKRCRERNVPWMICTSDNLSIRGVGIEAIEGWGWGRLSLLVYESRRRILPTRIRRNTDPIHGSMSAQSEYIHDIQ